MMKCPKGCEIDHGIVCGGSEPWFTHKGAMQAAGHEEGSEPNIYFQISLEGDYTKELVSTVPFQPTEADWQTMFDHADGGCGKEVQCPECLEYLDNVPD